MQINKKLSTAFVSLSLVGMAALPAFGQTVTIDFEGVGNAASISTFYAGGTDELGNQGPDLGVTFTGAAVAFRSDEISSRFMNAPTPGSALIALDSTATLNFGAGFVDNLGLSYSALGDAHDVVTIYGGLDRSGPVLGRISLADNSQLDGCDGAPLCHWQRMELSFGGIGKSIGFSGAASIVVYDDITITPVSDTTVSPVPEPGVYAMFALGLAAVSVAARRKPKA